jgi:hypothetical protein
MAVLCRGLEKNSMVRAWHGHGMASVNLTRPHFVNQMGKTHSKPLAARHVMGTAWARHAMCESALRITFWVSKADNLICNKKKELETCRVKAADERTVYAASMLDMRNGLKC